MKLFFNFVKSSVKVEVGIKLFIISRQTLNGQRMTTIICDKFIDQFNYLYDINIIFDE